MLEDLAPPPDTHALRDRRHQVRAVFDSAAENYDLMNDLMSAGVHRLWKATLINRLNLPRHLTRRWRLLDVAGGSGDIAFGCLARTTGPLEAVICDINPNMAALAQHRLHTREAAHAEGRLHLACGAAESLPFPDASADACTIAFGLRNVADLDAALAEAHRVLRPGGRFLCLEFSPAVMPGLSALYDAWSFGVIPTLGRMVSGSAAPYRYLVESIRRFPHPDALAARMKAAGLQRVNYESWSGGIAALHTGWRL